MKSKNEENPRRTFVKQSAILGVDAILAGSMISWMAGIASMFFITNTSSKT